ncbi:MAG: hypothetical protein N2169_01080 [bacterium]|nr:hypothetical protein [bacterium]
MILVFAKEEKWKYDDQYFYYPVCLPTLKLIENLYEYFQKKPLFIINHESQELIKKLIKLYNINLEIDLIESLDLSKDISKLNKNEKVVLIDLNSPLLYYKKEKIKDKVIKSREYKTINVNATDHKFINILGKSIEYIFKIRKIKDFEKLFNLIKKYSTERVNNVILGKNIFICPLSKLDENNTILDNTFIINSEIGKSNKIGPNCFITDSQIGFNNIISHSIITKNELINNNFVGPFTHLRENNIIHSSKIGAFVECKNIKVDGDLKASHLAYLGDLIIEENVNIGAGVVFANYDGKNKYTSIIKKNSFIGSNAVIISPKKIGPNSYIGAGSVVTKDVHENTIVIGNPARIHKKYETQNK